MQTLGQYQSRSKGGLRTLEVQVQSFSSIVLGIKGVHKILTSKKECESLQLSLEMCTQICSLGRNL